DFLDGAGEAFEDVVWRGEAVGEMGFGFGDVGAELVGVGAGPLAAVFAADQLFESFGEPGEPAALRAAANYRIEILLELSGGVDDGVATQRRAAAAGGLAAIEIGGRVSERGEGVGRQAGLLYGGLDGDGEEALAHLGVAGADADLAVRFDAEQGFARVGHAVADADVLDTAGDAGVFGVAVDVLDREQCLVQSERFIQLLSGGEAIARMKDVPPADFP